VFGGNQAAVQLAQAGDPRVTALEEQIRSLSGTIEELNFQILQMQEQMRKMQEDNEFRFQEIEKKTGATGGKGNNVAKNLTPPADAKPPVANDTAIAAPPGQTVEEVIVDSGTGEPSAAPGVPPRVFGTITFDGKGNVTGGSAGDQMSTTPGGQTDGTAVAALPATDNPDELYRNAYEFILSGDYGTAEAGFRDHISRFPADQKAADAHFWLGEALLGQKKYRDAAEIFLAANKQYPSAKKAPDMLLKLGVSLAGLDQRDVACATFSEIGKRYPNISGALKERVKQEQALASC
jgi:tol-pal system protein YbgF